MVTADLILLTLSFFARKLRELGRLLNGGLLSKTSKGSLSKISLRTHNLSCPEQIMRIFAQSCGVSGMIAVESLTKHQIRTPAEKE